jgi:endo-1,4-beta-xylanase
MTIPPPLARQRGATSRNRSRGYRAVLGALATACVAAVALSTIPAGAAEPTLGAAAEQSGRYFGTAIAANRLSDSNINIYTRSIPCVIFSMDPQIVVCWRPNCLLH